jgi:hypothetical protein
MGAIQPQFVPLGDQRNGLMEPNFRRSQARVDFVELLFVYRSLRTPEEYNRHWRASPCHLRHEFCILLSGFGDDHSIQWLILLQNDAQLLQGLGLSDVESSRTKHGDAAAIVPTEVNYPRSHSVSLSQTGFRVSDERQCVCRYFNPIVSVISTSGEGKMYYGVRCLLSP